MVFHNTITEKSENYKKYSLKYLYKFKILFYTIYYFVLTWGIIMDSSDNKNAVKGFMLPIIAGLAIFELITIAVFAVIGRFDLRVVWGALWGSAVMILYYFLFARAVTKAASGDPEDAKKRIQASYSMRMLLLIALMGAGLYLSTSLELINWVPMLLAVIFPRISIAVWQLISGTKKMYTSDADTSDTDTSVTDREDEKESED